MGREVRRVALDFDWRNWSGYFLPEHLYGTPCPVGCRDGVEPSRVASALGTAAGPPSETVDVCPTCQGRGDIEAYPGQLAEAEAWEPDIVPEGEGWQLWETVSEGGSPVSPVFATDEELARWMAHEAEGFSRAASFEDALRFVRAGSAPSFVLTPEGGLLSGVEHAGRDEAGDG